MRKTLLALTALLLLTLSSAAFACPMCKESISNDNTTAGTGGSNGPSATLPGGFNTSVYLMLVGFLATLGLVSFTIVRGIRGSGGNGFPVIPKDQNKSKAKASDEALKAPRN